MLSGAVSVIDCRLPVWAFQVVGFSEHELKPFLTSNPRHGDGFDPPAVDFERRGRLKNLKLSIDGCRRFSNLPVFDGW